MAIALPVYEANAEAPDGLALPVFVAAAEAPASLKLPVYVAAAETPPSLKLPVWLFTENIPSTLTVAPEGGVALGGAAFIGNDPWFPVGGVTLGGAATVAEVIVLRLEWYPYGGAKLGGAATVATAWSTFAPTGGVALGGAAAVSSVSIQHYEIPAPTGGVVLSGHADMPITVDGGVTLGGAATVVAVHPLEVVPTGGVTLAGAASVLSVSLHVPAGGVLLGGSAPVADYYPVFVPSGGVTLGGVAVAFMLPAGGVSTPENPYNDAFPGWAINLDTGAPSRYAGLAANSMFQFEGKTYVTNAGGVYEVAGKTDAGQPIRAAVTLPRSDFGDGHEKRVPYVYIGAKSDGPLVLKVLTTSPSVRYYAVTRGNDAVRGHRVVLGKGLKSRYWQFRLENKAGAYFDLDSVEIAPTVLKQRGA